MPEDGIPMSTSPFETFLGNVFPRSIAPTANPARSKSLPSYIPGISAVSPPTSAVFACLHPSAIPFITFDASLTSSFPVAK